jgi:hypothetical protein
MNTECMQSAFVDLMILSMIQHTGRPPGRIDNNGTIMSEPLLLWIV